MGSASEHRARTQALAGVAPRRHPMLQGSPSISALPCARRSSSFDVPTNAATSTCLDSVSASARVGSIVWGVAKSILISGRSAVSACDAALHRSNRYSRSSHTTLSTNPSEVHHNCPGNADTSPRRRQESVRRTLRFRPLMSNSLTGKDTVVSPGQPKHELDVFSAMPRQGIVVPAA